MGLDTTHGCWNGPYSAFARWREAVAAAAGITDLGEFWSKAPVVRDELMGRWAKTPDNPLMVLLMHADNEGVIQHAQCQPLATALTELLPKLQRNHVAVTERFIAGLCRACSRGEDVEFH